VLRASIDIGSNSVLLLAGDMNQGLFSEKMNEANISGLGKNLDKKSMFAEASMDKTFQILKKYKEKIESLNLTTSDVIVTATEASRVAKNAELFFKKVKEELGFRVKVITSEGEAYYTGLGISSGHIGKDDNEKVVMDIGGASTELIKIKSNPFSIISSVSLPVGSVRATEWLREGHFENKLKEIMEMYSLRKFQTYKIICVAGTMTSLAAMLKGLKLYKDNLVDEHEFDFLTFHSFVSKLKKLKPPEILKNFPVVGKRFETILGGAIVGLDLGQALNVKKISISTRGLRYGTLFEGVIHGRFVVKEF
jgi:exopolyphosphatase/guanosine-5'-triphosphate,3'-diphosphate pyrophosphatase